MKSRKASTEGTKKVKTATPDARPIAIADALRAGLEVRSEVVFAYLYGSAADGRCHDLSDVDVAVFLDPAAEMSTGQFPLGFNDVTLEVTDPAGAVDVDTPEDLASICESREGLL